MNEIIELRQADMLAAINRSEVDMQISTAKQFPRDIQAALVGLLCIASLVLVNVIRGCLSGAGLLVGFMLLYFMGSVTWISLKEVKECGKK